LLRNKPATQAGTTKHAARRDSGTTRTEDNSPGHQNHPEDHHHERGGRQPSQPAEQTDGVVLFGDGSPRGIIRHHELLTERVLSSPAGRESPLPPPAGPPGPDPPPASASKAGTSQHRACQDQYAGQNDPEAMVCLRFTLRTSLPLLMRATVEQPRSLGAQRERQGAPIVRSHCSRTARKNRVIV
jgi:hypothetical protein